MASAMRSGSASREVQPTEAGQQVRDEVAYTLVSLGAVLWVWIRFNEITCMSIVSAISAVAVAALGSDLRAAAQRAS